MSDVVGTSIWQDMEFLTRLQTQITPADDDDDDENGSDDVFFAGTMAAFSTPYRRPQRRDPAWLTWLSIALLVAVILVTPYIILLAR